MTQAYRINSAHYVLYTDDKPTGLPLKQLSLAFNTVTGELYKHGDPSMVQTWATLALKRLVSASQFDQAHELIVITGRIPLEDVNQCLGSPGYCLVLLAKVLDGFCGTEP